MNPFSQLEIPRRQTACGQCGARFLPEMELYSRLIEEESKNSYRREDFCLACWDPIKGQKSQEPLLCSYWRSSMEKKQKEEKSQRKERALALLKSAYLSSSTLSISEEEGFVLALLLLRARKLALRQQLQRGEETYGLYEILGEDRFLTIKMIPLSSLQIEKLQKSLADKF